MHLLFPHLVHTQRISFTFTSSSKPNENMVLLIELNCKFLQTIFRTT
jgi:hypothetical protein